MKGMDIEGVNKKLSSIVGESIDVGISYDKSMKPTLIESIKKDIPDIWKKVQAIERGEPLEESTEINEEAVDQKTAIKHLYRLFRGKTAGIDFRVLIKNIKDNPEGKFRLLRKGDQTIVVDDNDKEMGSWSSKKLSQESKEKWIIKDWAGNYPFQKGGYQGSGHLNKPEMVFDSFEDAEEWLGSWPEESVNEAQGMDLLDRAKEYMRHSDMQSGGAWAVSFRDVKDFLKENPKSSWKELKAMMDEAQKEELMDADHMVDRLPGEDVDESSEIQEKKLTYSQRKALPASDFVFPKTKKYPINDIAHGRNALARVSADGTPSEKKAVKAAVYARYPSLKEDGDLDNDVRNAVVGKGFDHKEQEMGNWSNFNDAFTEFLKNSK